MVATVKRNILKGYYFIGLLEEIELSLEFLEHKMPQFLSQGSNKDLLFPSVIQ